MRIHWKVGAWVLVLFLLCVPEVFAWTTWPDTGQTKCYNDTVEIPCPAPGQPFYGQDAQYQGPTRFYTKLGQNGVVLADDATQESGWVMTRDNVTGLVWEMKTDDSGIHDKDNEYTWANAQSVFIATLNQQYFGGFSDWRMPTIKELSSLVNRSIPYPGPTVDAAWFPRTVSWNYWSSSTYAGNTSNAWRVHFYGGNVDNETKAFSYYVRAVRGNSSDNATLVDNGDGTITDTKTELMWQKATAPGTYTWQSALSYCEDLNLAGYTDWRLPDSNELQSLVDYSRYNPAIAPLLTSDTVSSVYWSSTTQASNTIFARFMGFNNGYTYGNDKANNYYVRAVRSVTITLHDTTPDQFTFIDQMKVALSTVITSNIITVSGIDAAASISITGGTYSINGGSYTSSGGTVNNGNTVTVRQTSSGNYSTTTNATLTIGGVSDTFTVKTERKMTGLPWLQLLLGD